MWARCLNRSRNSAEGKRSVAQLCVDAAVEGNREKALQCLLLDPVITDIDTARKILDDYLTSYKEYLPQFWE